MLTTTVNLLKLQEYIKLVLELFPEAECSIEGSADPAINHRPLKIVACVRDLPTDPILTTVCTYEIYTGALWLRIDRLKKEKTQAILDINTRFSNILK